MNRLLYLWSQSMQSQMSYLVFVLKNTESSRFCKQCGKRLFVYLLSSFWNSQNCIAVWDEKGLQVFYLYLESETNNQMLFLEKNYFIILWAALHYCTFTSSTTKTWIWGQYHPSLYRSKVHTFGRYFCKWFHHWQCLAFVFFNQSRNNF